MSLRSKLLISCLVVSLLPALLVGFVTYRSCRKLFDDVRLSYMRELAALKADKIVAYFEGLRSHMRTAGYYYNIAKNLPLLSRHAGNPASAEFREARKQLDAQLRPVRDALRLADILLLGPDGRVLYSSVHENLEKDLRKPFRNQAVFLEGQKGIHVSEVYLGRQGRPEMLIGGPASRQDGGVSGVIIFDLDMDSVYELSMDQTGLGATGEVLLGKREGNLARYIMPLRHDPDAALKRGVVLGGRQGGPMQNAVLGRTGAGLSVDYRGEDVLAAWRPIPSLGWGMVVEMDIHEAYAPIWRLRSLLALLLAALCAAGGTAALALAASVSTPLKKLTEGAVIVGGGDLDYKVSTDRRDEIGALSRAFDAMTAELKRTMASRDDLNAEVQERKRAEEKLRRTNENLEQFAYVASHDLQEPLRMMASYSELLERRYKGKLDADADEFIHYIVDGAKRLQWLISDLLAYSRVGRAEQSFSEFGSGAALDRALQGMKAAIEESGAAIERGNLPRIFGSELLLSQLFQNLVSNALKFRRADPLRVEIGAEKRGEEWVFSVRDNGIGLEPRYKEKIFTLFQRLHARDKYPGTGIGLAICKKIAGLHGGRIWVESEPGKGATFFFTIPARKGAP